jgi:carboxyl-terminal processing protease
MNRPPRQPLVALLLVLLPVFLIGGIWLGGHPTSLPDPIRDAFVSDDQAQVYQEAVDTIARDYYRKVSKQQLLDSSLSAAVASLHDRFSRYLDPASYRRFQDDTAGQFSGVGVNVVSVRQGLRVVQARKGAPAQKAGIRAGDVIVAVDGRSIAGLSSDRSTKLILGNPGTSVSLTIVRAGHRRVFRVTRAKLELPLVESRLRQAAGTPVLDVGLAQFSSGVHGTLRQAIDRGVKKGAKGIVFDLRDDPGGLVTEAQLVASVFIPKGKIVTTDGRNQPRKELDAVGSAISTRIPVVVLVNRNTASAAEIVTGALQDHHRATVVGTRTFGKGVYQQLDPLPHGGALDLTVGQYFLPSGRNLGGGGVKEGAGIKPDVPASDNPKTRRDEALDAALRALARKLPG